MVNFARSPRFQRHKSCSLLCFTESWLHSSVSDSACEIDGFTLVRSDIGTSSCKSKGGGICVHVNSQRCRQYTIKGRICDEDVEILYLTLRLVYLQREFGCVLLFVVYVPRNRTAKRATATVAACVHTLQQQHPEAPAIVVADMNQ